MPIYTSVTTAEEIISILEGEPLLAGRFANVSVLGQGGSGVVCRALDRNHNNREVAFKLLVNKGKPLGDKGAFDEATLRRFREELRVSRELNHPNLVKAFELIEGERTITFTMEFIEGKDLWVLMKERPLPIDAIVAFIDQLLAAVEELHRFGILHRDIKLDNIMIRHDNVLKLTDLGIIKSPELLGLTKTNFCLGTAQYMPPEYVRKATYDQRGDIYSIGCVFYELLAGKRRFPNKDANDVLDHLLRTDFEISSLPLTGAPKRLISIVVKALAVDPKARFQSVAEMRESLREARALAAQEDTTVERQGTLSTSTAQHRLSQYQMNHIAAGNRSATRALTKAVGASLVIMLVAVAGIYQFSHTPAEPILNLDPGTYTGQLVDAAADTTTSFEIEVLPSPSEYMLLSSSNPRCQKASIRLTEETLTCRPHGTTGSFTIVERGINAAGSPYLIARIGLPDTQTTALVRFE